MTEATYERLDVLLRHLKIDDSEFQIFKTFSTAWIKGFDASSRNFAAFLLVSLLSADWYGTKTPFQKITTALSYLPNNQAELDLAIDLKDWWSKVVSNAQNGSKISKLPKRLALLEEIWGFYKPNLETLDAIKSKNQIEEFEIFQALETGSQLVDATPESYVGSFYLSARLWVVKRQVVLRIRNRVPHYWAMWTLMKNYSDSEIEAIRTYGFITRGNIFLSADEKYIPGNAIQIVNDYKLKLENLDPRLWSNP